MLLTPSCCCFVALLELSSTVNITAEGFDFGGLGVELNHDGIDVFGIATGCQISNDHCAQWVYIDSSANTSTITIDVGTSESTNIIFGSNEYGMDLIHSNIFITGITGAGADGNISCAGLVQLNNKGGSKYELRLDSTSITGLLAPIFEFYAICDVSIFQSANDTLIVEGTPAGDLTITTSNNNNLVINDMKGLSSSIIYVLGSNNIIKGPRYELVADLPVNHLSSTVTLSIDASQSDGYNLYDLQLAGIGNSAISIVGHPADQVIVQVSLPQNRPAAVDR
jgi:hypothetical protein